MVNWIGRTVIITLKPPIKKPLEVPPGLVLQCNGSWTGFSLGLNDRAQRPVVLFSALSFFLSALSFFQRPVIFREPFGFFGLSSALFWAWSCRKRPIKAKGGVIFVHHVVVRVAHRRHLGFTMNINLCTLVRPVVFQDQREHCLGIEDLHKYYSGIFLFLFFFFSLILTLTGDAIFMWPLLAHVTSGPRLLLVIWL